MKIEIVSHLRLVFLVQKEKIENLIFISSPSSPFFVKGTQEAVEASKNHLVLLFDDICRPVENCQEPRKEDIEKALSFSDSCIDDIIVSCNAGVSRSSAIAYLIAAKKFGVEKAVDTLDFFGSWPNDLIISLGAEILGLPILNDEIKKFKGNIRKMTNPFFSPEK